MPTEEYFVQMRLDRPPTLDGEFQEPDLNDPDAAWAEIRRLFEERCRYHLPPGRSRAELRRSCAVSQEELAARLRIKQARLSKLERHANPKLSDLKSYVAALGGELILLARLPCRDVHLVS